MIMPIPIVSLTSVTTSGSAGFRGGGEVGLSVRQLAGKSTVMPPADIERGLPTTTPSRVETQIPNGVGSPMANGGPHHVTASTAAKHNKVSNGHVVRNGHATQKFAVSTAPPPVTTTTTADIPVPKIRENVPAVSVQNACKTWKTGGILALDNCSITVEEGTIYGLLGPSGCGKTTLLNSIVGLNHLDSGELSVFGMKPGTPESGIPGRLVGFMPQDLALYPVFTVRESLAYFGTLGGMQPRIIKERTDFLLNFLALHKPDQRVGKLSGGQQRRVSLAVALISDPPLLILDEPTVGVDPMLRKNIWKYLLTLCREENSTIIITTHYIEEASRAHRVGLMRKGQILEEASPSSLLSFYKKSNLEDVFLHICETRETSFDDLRKKLDESPTQMKTARALEAEEREAKQKQKDSADAARQRLASANPMRSASFNAVLSKDLSKPFADGIQNPSFVAEEETSLNNDLDPRIDLEEVTIPRPKVDGSSSDSGSSERELSGTPRKSRSPLRPPIPVGPYPREPSPDYDNSILSIRPKRKLPPRRPRMSFKAMKALMIKNIVTVYRNIFLLLFELGIPPTQIALFALTIGNNPNHLPVAIYNAEVSSPAVCTNLSYFYSCDYLNALDPYVVTQVWTNSSEEALNMVLRKEAWGMITVPDNFSEHLVDRFMAGIEATSESINGSIMEVRLDMSSQTIAAILAEELFNSYQNFTKKMVRDLLFEVPEDLASLPIKFGDPIYGEREPRFAEFMAPGMLTALGYFMSLGLTALSFVQERKQGLLNRSVVAGVTFMEILLGHIMVQFVIMAGQNILALVFLLGIFAIPNRGSLFLVILLTLIQGLAGMTFGLLISAATKEEATAQIIGLGVFFPTLLLTGIVWPREAMAPWLEVLSSLLPQTHGVDGLRAIMSRGLGIEDHAVQLALYGPIVWTFIHIFFCWLIIVIRK